MAQKALKQLAAANTSRLNLTLILTFVTHLIYILLRPLYYHSTYSRRSLILYLVLSAPQLLINFQFERLSRPTYSENGSPIRAGEDLDAPGLTEYMWDVSYWTYLCVILSAILGDLAWWFYLAIPIYSVYAAWTTYTGVRGGFRQDAAGVPQPTTSKRQAKMEKRGGQRVAYR
ncbi:hypothetical protein B0J11DRAFT_553978 [Dendryphion nanum]|uniref:DUF788 domain-containing protein n=1 Tax=Dendryphion nanum TaxID=256645 RepID=A0A9P9IAX4_9PLEO|nr:hypothetical protein B0J11DRAFT_553978 [Dendryphion nanum]